MEVYHFTKVDTTKLNALFTADYKHRMVLEISFQDRNDSKTICIIGQNPSYADTQIADKTLHYLEKFVYEKLPQYSKIIMINLYSRIDTNKTHTSDLIRLECERYLTKVINENTDFLIVFGRLENQRAYKFEKKAKILKSKLSNKSVFKIDVTCNYAPHPGNKNICYSNYCPGITEYNFEDVI